MIYNDIIIKMPDGMSDREAMYYVSNHFEGMQEELGKIASIDISLDGDEVVLKAHKKSRIIRYARITGYVVPKDSMSKWKQSEVKQRVAHC